MEKSKVKFTVIKSKENYILRVYGNILPEVYENLTLKELEFITGRIVASLALSLK